MTEAVVVPYDSDWPRRFEAEQKLLERALAPWLSGGVHHVGSTAVPGLAAKPVIDMIAGVRHLEEARASFASLQTLGYHYHEHRPEAHSLVKPQSGNWWEATHHLHLTEQGSALWRERLAFRDALRADPELAAEYERWKVAHAAARGAANPYTANKNPFVTHVLVLRGIDVMPDAERLAPSVIADRQP